jgi:hypothetical protein
MHLSITQIDRRVLDRFHAAVLGVGKMQGPYTKRPINRKPIWRWRACSFEDCQATIALLWKFLSPIKRAQALDVMKRYAARPAALPGGRPFGSRNGLRNHPERIGVDRIQLAFERLKEDHGAA